MNLKTIIITGISGSGKGTQGRLLQEYLEAETQKKVEYIETGNFFRNFMKGDSFASNLAREVMEEGRLQPDFLAVWNWGSQFAEKLTGEEHLIVDGAPRRLPESSMLEHALKFFKRSTPYVFYLALSDEEARERLRGRGRADDTSDESINERLGWFKEHALPAIKYFKTRRNVYYHELDGSLSIEEIQKQIQDLIKAED